MNFSDSCRCGRPAPPCAPACGFLMQQIVGSGRTQLRCERFSLPLCGVPDSLCRPFACWMYAHPAPVRRLAAPSAAAAVWSCACAFPCRSRCAISAAAGLRAAPASRCLSPCVWAAVRSAARSTLPAPMCAWPAGAKAHPAIACRRRWMCACRHGPYAAALWPRRGNARPNARRPCPCIPQPCRPPRDPWRPR